MNAAQRARPVEILLVEDSPSDARLTQEAFQEGRVLNNLSVVTDGEEALKFLRREEEYADAPRPDLILLDLNLPRKDGREVLADIKSDEQLRSIPVCVLTTSADERDILQAYGLCANCYVTKPVDVNQFMEELRTVQEFWFSLVKLPTEP